jgi:HicB family
VSAKPSRFSYLPKAEETNTPAPSRSDRPTATAALRSVPRGDGRMEQARDQLNVRVPTSLKRQAVAKAALEGKSIGELVEELLYNYVSARTDS